MKLCALMLFKFQWQIHKQTQELAFEPGFSLMSPLSLIAKEWSHT